jgi:hypothetical protein
MDRLYDILMQAGYLPAKSITRRGDHFCRFHEAIRHNIEKCEEFH